MKYDKQLLAQERAKLIDFHIVNTSIFLSAVFFSIILLYNEKLTILNKKPLFDANDSKTADIIYSIVVFITVLTLQYINYKTKEFKKIENKDIKSINADIAGTYFLIIATIISIYSSYINPIETIEPISLV